MKNVLALFLVLVSIATLIGKENADSTQIAPKPILTIQPDSSAFIADRDTLF